MTGVRLFGRAGGGDWLDNPKTFPVWELAEELDFPIAVLLGIERAPKLAAMLERFPGVTVALDHLGSVTFEDGPPYETAAPIFDLAKFPNLRLKYSPTNEQTAERGPGNIKDVLQRIVDRFGVDRLMWGSNFSATYEPPYARARGDGPRIAELPHGGGKGQNNGRKRPRSVARPALNRPLTRAGA